MVFGGGKKQKDAEAAAERSRKEVLFWKDQLDHAVNEKKDLLERYTELYRHLYALEHANLTLTTENKELAHVLERTVHLQDERRSYAAPATPTSAASGASTPDGRSLQHSLTSTRAALKQADVRIAILEDRNLTLQQENDLLHKQNELLRSSEAAYQKEAQLLREELSNARGINDLTADETTKLLLDNSRLQQGVVAARSEVLHKDEMLRLLSAEINELNAKLEWYIHASSALGLDAPWDNHSLTAEHSSGSAPGSHPISMSPPTSLAGAAAPAAAPAASDVLLPLGESQEMPAADAAHAAAAANGLLVHRSSGSMTQRSAGGEGASPEVAAVEALAVALPLRMSTQVLRTSSQERRGTFSGQPITPRDMAELKHKLEQEGSSFALAPKSARSRGAASQAKPQPGSKDASSAGGSAALPPLPTPTGSNGGAAASSGGAAAVQQQQQQVLRVAPTAEEEAEGEEDDVDMLQGSPNLADALQRNLLRQPTPSLKLGAPQEDGAPACPTAAPTSGEQRCTAQIYSQYMQ
ncbi:hypothetical protein OEZ85_004800 [Tetradesmus obliquus]|uniref:Autophagy-related protein 16 domain-containing protein n=1 Tax=Tetradesmus obliquus TaxID=3088 RepID=A0ABY8UI86_TETOB|nr:hypothetical protein OEZ85_004800 [Tetradesmus obliquus]